MPKVSVIIPTYNRAAIIPRTIRSVLNQTFKDLELILVDDGSSDNTREVAELFRKKDNRIKYIHQDNSGAPARPKNTGIKNSQGEYIAFLDDDDEWLPNKLEKQINLFENSKVYNLGLVGCEAFVINKKRELLYKRKMPNFNDYVKELLIGNFIFTSSGVVVKRRVFPEVGLYDENFKIGDDWDMWIRIAQKYGFDFVREPLLKYYKHGENVNALFSEEKRIKEYEYGLEKYRHLYQRYPSVFSKRLVNIGRMHFFSSQKKEARRCFKNAIMVQPLYLRGYTNFLLSFGNTDSYALFAKIKKELVKFIVVGGLSTVINYLIFFTFYMLGIYYVLASGIGYTGGLLFGYMLNRNWTFSEDKSHNKKAREFIMYVAVYLLSLGISLLFIKLLVDMFYIDPRISNIFVIGLSTLTNFAGLKLIVFRNTTSVIHEDNN